MSAQVIQFDQARRFHAQLGHDALMRKVRIVARCNGCMPQQIVEVEQYAEYLLSQRFAPDDIVEQARKRAVQLAPNPPNGPEAA